MKSAMKPVLISIFLGALVSGCYWTPGSYSPTHEDQYSKPKHDSSIHHETANPRGYGLTGS